MEKTGSIDVSKKLQVRMQELKQRIEDETFVRNIVNKLGSSTHDFICWEFLLKNSNENTVNLVINTFLSSVNPEDKEEVFFAIENPRLSAGGLSTLLKYAKSTSNMKMLLRILPDNIAFWQAKKIADVIVNTAAIRYLDCEILSNYKILLYVLFQTEEKDIREEFLTEMLDELDYLLPLYVTNLDKLIVLSYTEYFCRLHGLVMNPILFLGIR